MDSTSAPPPSDTRFMLDVPLPEDHSSLFPRKQTPLGSESGASETGNSDVGGPLQSDRHDYLSADGVAVSISARSKKEILALKNELGHKLVIVMCGLPARGKSYICKKLAKYLSWCGFNTKVFNVGNRRRINVPPTQHPEPSDEQQERQSSGDNLMPTFLSSLSRFAKYSRRYFSSPFEGSSSPIFMAKPGTLHDSSFFDATNQQYKATREKLAMETLDELVDWLNNKGGKVGIHDATNSTTDRRRAIMDRLRSEKNIQVVFVESICTEGEVLEKNILMKLQGPDYINMPREQAIADFRARMQNYEKVYQTINEDEEDAGISYIKIINVGKKVIAHNIHGYLPSQCVFYLMQIHIKERTIWLTRHGESTYNRVNRIGGDPPLTELGARYAKAMNRFIQQHVIPETITDPSEMASRREGMQIWSSTLQRALMSVEGFEDGNWNVMHFKVLGEIFSGICEDMTYEEIARTYPEIWTERSKNKLMFRYPGPGGESYVDVIERLRPLIMELERMEKDAAIVTHQVVMRTLLAYFCNIALEEVPNLNVPLHTLYKLNPKPYGADVEVYQWNPETDDMVLIGGSELVKGS